MTRVLAIDYGTRRIGLAVSDALGITAQGLDTIRRKRIRADLDQIAAIAAEREVGLVIIGLPRHLDGRDGTLADEVRDFGSRVAERTGLPVEYWDERFSSVIAHRILDEGNVAARKRTGMVDRLAAVMMLEEYLASRS